jgi:6-phosphogluconolactonase
VIELLVLDDPAPEAARRIAAAADAGGHIALTGGSTPQIAYAEAAAMKVAWSGCTLWFGDERCVPPDDPRSNYGQARASLLDRLPDGQVPTVRRIEGELGPHDGAAAYETELRGAFGSAMPAFDLLLLGLGPDGHCASLFPGDPALQEERRLAVGVERPGLAPFVPRVTLTLPVLNAARETVFLVAGEDKAAAVVRAFGPERDPSVPAGLVVPASGKLTLLADPAAAGLLPQESRR